MKKTGKKSKLLMSVLSMAMVMSLSLPAYASEVPQVTSLAEDNAETQDNGNGDIIIGGGDGEGEVTLPPQLVMQNIIEDKTGSIEITLEDGKSGTSKGGVVFNLVKVADIEKGEYILTEDFKDSGVKLNEIKSSEELEEVSKKLAEYDVEGVKGTTTSDGKLKYDDLDVAVYLLNVTDDTNYDDVTPLLVAIPTFNEQTNDMLYNVTVNPKHSPKPDKSKDNAPQTNVDMKNWKYLGLSVAFLGLAGAILVIEKKRKKSVK